MFDLLTHRDLIATPWKFIGLGFRESQCLNDEALKHGTHSKEGSGLVDCLKSQYYHDSGI